MNTAGKKRIQGKQPAKNVTEPEIAGVAKVSILVMSSDYPVTVGTAVLSNTGMENSAGLKRKIHVHYVKSRKPEKDLFVLLSPTRTKHLTVPILVQDQWRSKWKPWESVCFGHVSLGYKWPVSLIECKRRRRWRRRWSGRGLWNLHTYYVNWKSQRRARGQRIWHENRSRSHSPKVGPQWVQDRIGIGGLLPLKNPLQDIEDGNVEQMMRYLERLGFKYWLGNISENLLPACERSIYKMVSKKGFKNVLEFQKGSLALQTAWNNRPATYLRRYFENARKVCGSSWSEWLGASSNLHISRCA